MNDTGLEFLKGEVEKARGRYLRAFDLIRKGYEELQAAKDDAIAMQNALAAYTRTSPDPYEPEELPNVSFGPIASVVPRSTLNIFTKNRPKHSSSVTKGKALDMSMSTKAGILRNVIHGMTDGMTIEEILQAIPKDAPIKVTKGDLYRMLPRFVLREELTKDGRVYRRVQSNEKSLFAEV